MPLNIIELFKDALLISVLVDATGLAGGTFDLVAGIVTAHALDTALTRWTHHAGACIRRTITGYAGFAIRA